MTLAKVGDAIAVVARLGAEEHLMTEEVGV
jgi:hypothetical protein